MISVTAPFDFLAPLDTSLALPVRLIGDNAMHVAAVLLARRTGLPATYDAHYLALAERLGAEFWTANRKLVRQVGAALPWVRCALDLPKGCCRVGQAKRTHRFSVRESS